MKKINRLLSFIFMCLSLSNVSMHGFYYGDDPGANVLGGAATGALIGGAVRGGEGAAIGAGIGAGVGLMSSAAANRRRRYDDYYYDRDYYRRPVPQRRLSRRQLLDRNAELEQRLQQYESGQE